MQRINYMCFQMLCELDEEDSERVLGREGHKGEQTINFTFRRACLSLKTKDLSQLASQPSMLLASHP